jgi:hypothetical protein
MLTKALILVILLFLLIICVYRFVIHKHIENFGFCGGQNLNRRLIWSKTRDKYGLNTALKMMPRTYLLPKELPQLMNDPNPQFILKTMWSGKRVGVELYDNKKNIEKDQHRFSVGQVYIKKPFLVNGFKFDVRFFLVVYCGFGAYLYLPAYCVYTRKPYSYHGLDRESKINQVATQESHYDTNKLPRLFSDIEKTNHNFNQKIVLKRLKRNLQMIMSASDKFCRKGVSSDPRFHIFGVDVEITQTLEPLIIEINSGPSTFFTEQWKRDLIDPMLRDIENQRFYRSVWLKIPGIKV